MAEAIKLKASVRERVGKGAARAVRREGLVPAVIYGDKKAPEAISLDYNELFKELNTGHFMSRVYQIELDGNTSDVLARDVHLDPVKDKPMHVDFLRIGAGTVVSVQVSVNFLNDEECPGLKEGGVLNIVRHELDLTCKPTAIPEMIEVDLTGLNIGDSIHISAITLPEGVTSTITDRDFTIATIAMAAVMTADDDVAPEDMETEVEGEEGGEDSEEGGEEKS